MNNYQIRGWVEQVIEIAFNGTDGVQNFHILMNDDQHIPMRMFCQVVPTSAGNEPLGAMVEGQLENVVYVRINCPAPTAGIVFQMLADVAREAAPPTPQG